MVLLFIGTVTVSNAMKVYAFYVGQYPQTNCHKIHIVVTDDKGNVYASGDVNVGTGGPCGMVAPNPNCPDDGQYGITTDTGSTYCFSTLFSQNSGLYQEVIDSANNVIPSQRIPLSITPVPTTKYVIVAPNILNDGQLSLRIEFQNSIESTQLSVDIMDIAGKLVHHQKIENTGSQVITLPKGTESGLYIVQLKNANIVLQQEKLTIQ